jgi:hypothetical protein
MVGFIAIPREKPKATAQFNLSVDFGQSHGI